MGFPSPLKYTPSDRQAHANTIDRRSQKFFFLLAPPLAGAMYAVTFSVVSVSTKCKSRLGRLC